MAWGLSLEPCVCQKADGLGPLAGALCEPLKGLGHQGGDGCWWQGLGFYRAGGRTGLEAALVRGVGVVTRSHGQRWKRPVLGINVVMNTALRFSSAQPGGPTQGYNPVSPVLRELPP